MVAAFDVVMSLETGHVCAYCNGALEMLEESVLLQIVYPAKQNGALEYYDIEDESGDYMYEPFFFHLNCWEESVENDLCAHREDEPPMLDGRGVAECDGCTSDILAWETSGILTLGEFQRAQRSPDGQYPSVFVPFDTMKPRPLCVSCLHIINEDILEMWESGITHMDACEDGIHGRCWRYGCEEPGHSPNCRLFNSVEG